MSKLVTGDGRTHIQSPLMKESLVDRRVLKTTDSSFERSIMPDVVLVSIGGQSIFDRGKAGLVPLTEELAAARKATPLKMIIGVGGGTRVRHTISVALDLGISTGGMAQLVGAMEECNAIFLNTLMAQHGSITMPRDHFWELPLYLDGGILPIVISVPPYHFWEPPSEDGPLPSHGSDFGLFIHAEVLGMQRMIFVKDEDGLYDKDPKKHKGAKKFGRLTLDELFAVMPEETILDRTLFKAWRDARHVKHIQIVNGLVRGQLTAALAGDDTVGTVITKETGR
jgi:molybdenum storage protein